MSRYDEAFAALGVVIDPELDEPITDLGFVRSLVVSPAGNIKCSLRLPTSFCSPNFAYLMASDAKDVLVGLDWSRNVVVELDDHHDSPIINAGLAADAGYRGTFKHEAESSLDELREIFKRKAHTASMERCLTALLRADRERSEESMGSVRLTDLPDDDTTAALLRRRTAIGLSTEPDDLVMVDHEGRAPENIPLALRKARSTRISIDGNSHFCRGLLRTRYGHADEASAGQTPDPTFIPLSSLLPA